MKKLLNKIFKRNYKYYKYESLGELQKLIKKYWNGISEESDIEYWEKYLNVLKKDKSNDEVFYFSRTLEIEELFYEYLLKHHASDIRIREKYKSSENIMNAKKAMYRRMIITTLGEALLIINKFEYPHIIEEIQEYVYYKDNNHNMLYSTYKCDKTENEKLLEIINKIKDFVSQEFKNEKEWHLKADNLYTFKI